MSSKFLIHVKKQKKLKYFEEMHRPDARMQMILRGKLPKIDMRMSVKSLRNAQKQKVLRKISAMHKPDANT